jgi:hypothetical protein
MAFHEVGKGLPNGFISINDQDFHNRFSNRAKDMPMEVDEERVSGTFLICDNICFRN